MRRPVVLIALAFLLASCAGPALPAPTAASTATPAPSATLGPTLTPTVTPSPTPDPNMPPDASGRNMLGDYLKTVTENGRTVTYIWRPFQFGNDAASGIKGHWFESRMSNGPIDLTGYGENCREFWGKLSMPMTVYAMQDLHDLDKLGYLFHPDGPSDYITKDFQCASPPNIVLMDLFMNKHGLLPEKGSGGDSSQPSFTKKFYPEYYPSGTPTDPQRSRFANDYQAMLAGFKNGEGITVGDQLWEPRKGYEVYWIAEDAAAADPSFHVSVQAYTTKNFYWKVLVRDGTLTAIIAPAGWLRTQLAWPKADSRERIFRWITLYPLQMVIDGEDVVNDNPGALAFQDYARLMGPIPGYPKGGINTSWIALTP